MLLVPFFLGFVAFFCSPVLAAFGLTSSSSSYVLNAGSSNSLVVTVSRTSCDITSILYRGEEFQYSSTGSHIASGLSPSSVEAEAVGSRCLPAIYQPLTAQLTCSLSGIPQGDLCGWHAYSLHCCKIRRQCPLHGNLHNSRAQRRRASFHCPS